MKTGFFKGVALSGVAMLAFAQPASALTIGFNDVGNELQVVASDLGGEIIAAWDIDIMFDPALTVLDVVSGGELGAVNDDTIFDWGDLGGGMLDAFEVSFLSDAELAALQNGDSVLLATITFDQELDLFEFKFIWDEFNDVKCANNRVCFPPQVAEPGSLAILGLGLFGLGLSRRRLTR